MMRAMLNAPPGARLTGRPVTLAEVVAGASSRNAQSQRIDAYWDLCAAVADYYLGLREQDEVQRLRTLASQVGPTWQQAEAELGVRITTSKGFHWGKGDMYGERLGRHVWKDLVPLRRLLDHGIPVGCGTDWGPRNIFEQVQLAVTCEFAGSGHRNLDSGQAVTREEALLMWTRDAARVLDWQGVGTLAPGHHADLIFVDRNPLTCPLEDLSQTTVLRTLFDGRTVYEK